MRLKCDELLSNVVFNWRRYSLVFIKSLAASLSLTSDEVEVLDSSTKLLNSTGASYAAVVKVKIAVVTGRATATTATSTSTSTAGTKRKVGPGREAAAP